MPLSETTDPENQFAYEALPPAMDWAAKTLEERQERYRKEHPGVPMGALLWRVQRR